MQLSSHLLISGNLSSSSISSDLSGGSSVSLQGGSECVFVTDIFEYLGVFRLFGDRREISVKAATGRLPSSGGRRRWLLVVTIRLCAAVIIVDGRR